jgi:hypothetical protein
VRWGVPRAGLNWLHHNYLGPSLEEMGVRYRGDGQWALPKGGRIQRTSFAARERLSGGPPAISLAGPIATPDTPVLSEMARLVKIFEHHGV